MRKTVLALALLGPLAFAPAPFPKSNRQPEPDDLKKLQGDWYRIEYDGQPERPATHTRITGNRLEFVDSSSGYVFTLDVAKRPRRIDIATVPDQTPSFRGVYRIEGDTFTYCIRGNVSDADRPLDFETGKRGAWTAVYVRKKP